MMMTLSLLQKLSKLRKGFHKAQCTRLLMHLFHFTNTELCCIDVNETMHNILERATDVFYPYRNKKEYGNIRMACSQCFDDYPKQMFVEFYYEVPNYSTKVIQFSFYPYTGLFKISGRRIGFGERKPYIITYDPDIACLLLEQRIKEIPCEIETLYKKHPFNLKKTLAYKNCLVPILKYIHMYNYFRCRQNLFLTFKATVLELSATLNMATCNKKSQYKQLI